MALTESAETEAMSVIVPVTSGDTEGSMSRRISDQASVLKPRVVRSLRLGPQPTWRKVFMGFCLKASGCT
jgi:hypothetical protein